VKHGNLLTLQAAPRWSQTLLCYFAHVACVPVISLALCLLLLPAPAQQPAQQLAQQTVQQPASSTIPSPPSQAATADPSPDEILRSAREHQDRSREQQVRWIFDQEVFVRLLRGGGKLAREERRFYRVRPNMQSTDRELTALQGQVVLKGKVHPYFDTDYRHRSMDIDGELTESFSNDLMDKYDPRADRGDDDSVYPLSKRMLEGHDFTFHGRDEYKRRSVFRFTFQPKPKNSPERGFWEGEILIDTASLAPVLIITHQAKGVPLVVRTLLGSNVRQLGYRLEYTERDDGTWFPSIYSAEFSFRILFGYARRVAMMSRNSNFLRASAESSIRYDDKPLEPSPSSDSSSESPAPLPSLDLRATPHPFCSVDASCLFPILPAIAM